jgi:hypothetical protein
MNERIKELMSQATTYYNGGLGTEIESFDKEKFAELIVRECDRYARSAWEHGPLLGRDLLVHFGIVEMKDE